MASHPQKSPALQLSMRASAALPMVLKPCLREVSSAVKQFERSRGVREVHKLRVAIRRAHTALTVFRELTPSKSSSHLDAELHRLQRRIGVVREWDVFIAGALRNGDLGLHKRRFASAYAKASRRRKKAARHSAADFDSKRFRKLMRHLEAFAVHVRDTEAIRRSNVRNGTSDLSADPLVSTFANDVLLKYYARFELEQRKAKDLGSRHLHALRIRVKKLRYVAEFFRDLYPVRPMRRFLSVLTTFQDQLGEVHDFYVAQSKMAGLKKKKNHAAVAFRGDVDTLGKLTAAEKLVWAAAGAIGVEHSLPPKSYGAVSHD